MDALKGIRQIILYDDCDDDEIPPEDDLELCISKTDAVHYNKTPGASLSSNKSTLRLRNYVGPLYIPSITGLAISNLYRDIVGIVGSPAMISGHGNLNLVIEEDKGIELCLLSTDVVRVNNELKYYREGTLEKAQVGAVGSDFDIFRMEYTNYVNKTTPKYTVDEDKCWKRADFSKAKIGIRDMDVCLHYNLVLVNKPRGTCNIFYKEPNIDTKEEFKLQSNKVLYHRLNRELKFAEFNEEYDKIPLLQNRMKTIENRMKRLEKIINSIPKSPPTMLNPNFDPQESYKNKDTGINVPNSNTTQELK